jgi:membrane protease YdiL (CAAX protease family)
MERAAQRDAAEVLIVVGTIAAILWFGRGVFPGSDAVFAVVLLAILAYSHWRAHEGWRELGFRLDTFWPTIWLLVPAIVMGCILTWSASVSLRAFGAPPAERLPNVLAVFVAFGIAQQYVMLGFIFKRMQRVAGARLAPTLTALLFALLHLPNLFLTTVTFVWGVVASYVYRRSPNLWANGLVHGLMSAWVCYALPPSVTHGLRVGMEYLGLS